MTPKEALYFIDDCADGGLGGPDYCEAFQVVMDALDGLDALRARVEELEAQNNALAEIADEHVNTAHRYRDALEHYAEHTWDCPMFNPSERDRKEGWRCGCRARVALEALGLPTHL